jgi:hypothetical protein
MEQTPITLNNVPVDKLLDVLAYAYVLGWYAGTDGKKTDEGKTKAAHEQLAALLRT